MRVQCAICGTGIERSPSRVRERNFCSEHNPTKRNRLVVQCAHCGGNIERLPRDIQRNSTGRFYCSLRCHDEERKDRTALSCAICGKEIERRASKAKNRSGLFYCSEHNPSKLNRVIVQCDTCGADIERRCSQVGERNYCSRKCAYANPIRSALLSSSTAAYLARNESSRSAIERTVEEHLTLWDFDFITQNQFRTPEDYPDRFACCVDFYLPQLNTVIECNGSYFHSDPQRYPDRDALDQLQQENLARYEKKRGLLDRLGIRIIELWERDNARFKQLVIVPLLELECQPERTHPARGNHNNKRLDAAKEMEQVKWA